MQQLRHPNIVTVLDGQKVDDDGYHFFPMEYITGGTLHDAITAGQLNQDEILQIS